MMSSELITIIVPIFNGENFLATCIQSIKNQTHKSLEIIIIDDGSTDNSLKICLKIAEEDKRIKVIQKKNGGVSSARNMGLSIAQGDYVAFVDCDDYIDSNMYECMLKEIKNHNSDIAICGKREYRGKTLNSTKILSYNTEVFNPDQALIKLFTRNEFDPGVCNKLFKRDIIKGLYFPDSRRVNEELVYVYDSIISSRKIVSVNQAFYNINIGNKSATRTAFSLKFLDSMNAFDEILSKCSKNYSINRYVEINKIVAGMSILARIARDTNSHEFADLALELRNELIYRKWKYLFSKEMQLKHKFKYALLVCSLNLFNVLVVKNYNQKTTLS